MKNEISWNELVEADLESWPLARLYWVLDPGFDSTADNCIGMCGAASQRAFGLNDAIVCLFPNDVLCLFISP